MVAVFDMHGMDLSIKMAVNFLAQFLQISVMEIRESDFITLINKQKTNTNYGKNYWY